jgi:hypothetical protein
MKRRMALDPDLAVVLPDGSQRSLTAFLLPNAMLTLAGLLLTVSILLPYWSLRMSAPQYPQGLKVSVYVNHLDGDVREVDALNHYLGMPPLDEGGRLERSISVLAVVALGLLLSASVFVHNRWAALLAVPALIYPLLFVGDLWLILHQYGHSIDPQSALGGAIQPFTPPLLGYGSIGQFGTFARFEAGFYVVLAAVAVTLAGLWFHRAAYKPVMDARRRARQGG